MKKKVKNTKVKRVKRKKFNGGGQGLGKASMGLGMVSGTIGNVLEESLVDTDKMKGGAKGVYTGAKMAGDILSKSPEPISNLIGQGIKILTPALAGMGQKIKEKRQNLDPEYEKGNSNLFTTGSFGFAYGGKIPFDTSQLIQFKGPKHKDGGIPIDFDQDGIEESEVEGGETMKDGYVFSDQLGYDKKNNPTEIKKKVKTTFADKSKSIENKFKGRFDETSQFTKELEMKKLQNHNEVVRKKVNSKKQKGFQRKQFSGGGDAQLANQLLKAANRDTIPLKEPDDLTPGYELPDYDNFKPRFDINNIQYIASPLSSNATSITNPLDKLNNTFKSITPSTGGATPEMRARATARASHRAYANAYDQKIATANAAATATTATNNNATNNNATRTANTANTTTTANANANAAANAKPGTAQSKSTGSTTKAVKAKSRSQYDPKVAEWQQQMLNFGYKDSDMGFKGKPDGIMGNRSSALLDKIVSEESVEKEPTVPELSPKTNKIENRKLPEFSFNKNPEDLFSLTKQQLRKDRRVDRREDRRNNGNSFFGDLTEGDRIQLGAAFANYGSKLAQSMKKLDKEPVWTNQNESAVIAQIENLKTDTRQAKNDLNRSVEAGKQTIAANSRSVGAQLANNQALANKEMSARNELSIKEMEFENNKKLQLADALNQFGESNKQERKQAYINRQQNKAARDMMRAEANNKLESALTALGQGKNQAKLNTQQFNMIKEMSKEFGYGKDYKSFLKDINGAGLLEYLGQPLDVKAAGQGNAATTAAKVKAKKEKNKNKNS